MERFFNLLNENKEFYDWNFFDFIESLPETEKRKLSITIGNYIHVMEEVRLKRSKELQKITEILLERILKGDTES